MFIQNIGQYISVVRISDEREILNVEFLGLPFRSTKDHTVGDVKKLLIMAVCSLCYSLGDYLDCSVEDAKKVKSYSIQVIEVMEPLIMGENKNTDELSSIWRKRFINALKITTNNAETDQTARQIATLLINQKQSSTTTKFWKQLKIDKSYESARERLQNKKVFRAHKTIQVASEFNLENSGSDIQAIVFASKTSYKRKRQEKNKRFVDKRNKSKTSSFDFNPFYDVDKSPSPTGPLTITSNKP
ncbi:10224_t:CDS:2 [Entrophospora sp. SA101]|nr:10224_t:CDS:2 [Entrophospora sp. SA101]